MSKPAPGQMPWRIYYGDGTVYEGPAKDAPPLDVQAIAQADNRGWSQYSTGRMIYHSFDFYLYCEGQWIGVNSLVDLVDHILHRPIDKVLKGRMITHERWEAIMERAQKDRDLPRKGSQRPWLEDGRKAGQGSGD
jgi:hypothetical protein